MSKKGDSKKKDTKIEITINKLQIKSERMERTQEALIPSSKMIQTQNSIINDASKKNIQQSSSKANSKRKMGHDAQLRSSRILQTKKSLEKKKARARVSK